MATPTPGSSFLFLPDGLSSWCEHPPFLGWSSNTLRQGINRSNWPWCQKYLAHKDSASWIANSHRVSIYTLAICYYTSGYCINWEFSYMTETYQYSIFSPFLFVSYFFFPWKEEINHCQFPWQLTLCQKLFSSYRIRWCMSWKLREESQCYCRINIKIFLQ